MSYPIGATRMTTNHGSWRLTTLAAAKAGDSVRTLFFPGAGHFEIASATQWTWPRVETAIRALLDGRLPADEKAS